MSRQATRAQRDWLEREIAAWQAMGVIDADRATQLLALYESKASLDARSHAKGILTLVAIAAFLMGLGVFLLIDYNCVQMPAALIVTAIFAAMIGTHAAGYGLRYRLGWRRPSEVVFFLGCLFYGAAMALLAQIFQIESTNYDSLWWWAIGVLPFALLLDTILIHLLFAGLLALWLGFEVFSLERLFWGVPSSGYSVPLLLAPGLWWAYRKSSATTVGIYIPLLAWWVVLQPIAWKMQANPTYFIGAVGSLMLLVAGLHPARSEMAIPYRFYGVALVASTLVLLSFHSFNEIVARGGGAALIGGVEQMVLILIMAAAALAGAYFLQRSSLDPATQTRAPLVESTGQVVAKNWLPFALLALFCLLAAPGTSAIHAWVPTVAANVAMVAVSLWLIRFGLNEDRSRAFGAGVLYLLLWAVLRYIDLFASFGGMLGAALMFFLCGGALIGVALYWRNRKAVSLG